MKNIFAVCICFLLIQPLFSQKSDWILESAISMTDRDWNNLEEYAEAKIITAESLSRRINLYSVSFDKPLNKQQLDRFNDGLVFYRDKEIQQRETVPNDPEIGLQWALPKIGLFDVWDETVGGIDALGREIVVAVIDDAFQINHEDFDGQVWTNDAEIPDNGLDDDNNGYIDDYFGLNLATNTDNHPSLNSHGTAVAGVIGAKADNGLGIAGANWNIKIMFLSEGTQVSKIIKGYEYVYEQRKLFNDTNGAEGALVVATNFSGGIPDVGPDSFPAWCDVYDALGDVGVLNAGAVPNANVDLEISLDMPSDCPSDFTIMATNTNSADFKVDQAGFGSTVVDLGAPGEDIYTLKPNDEYRYFSGTSASCPYVASAIALICSMNCEEMANNFTERPRETALEIKSLIMDNVDKFPFLTDLSVSGGRLNVFKAMNALAAGQSNPDENTLCNSSVNELDIISESGNAIGITNLSFAYSTDKSENHRVIFSDVLGRVIYSYVDNPSIFSLNTIDVNQALDRLTTGLYFVSVSNSDETASYKFFLNN